MRRYDFERYDKTRKQTLHNRYYIFDRQSGTTRRIAVVYDVADAEMICNALNYSIYKESYADVRNNTMRHDTCSSQR